MFKLVVLSTLMAVAAANPSVLGPWGLGSLGLAGVASPLGLAGVASPLGLAGVASPLGLAGVASPLGLTGVASPLGIGPLGLGVPALGVPALGVGHLGGIGVAPAIGAYNYRGPLSLAPGQPANIVASDGRPLDTLSVNLDRAAHITAKAVSGAHILRKRSAPLLAPLAVSHTSRIDLPGRIIGPAPLALAAPGHLGLAGPIGPLGLAPLGLGSLGLGLRRGIGLGHGIGLESGIGLGHSIW